MIRLTLVTAACVLFWPAAAQAVSGSGPHETVDISISTDQVNASAGLTYTASYHGLANPAADPPALRRIVIVGPPGTRSDTSVPGQCMATDEQLKNMGEAACPADSRIGSGWVEVKPLGLLPQRLDTTIFNGPGEQIELVKFGNAGGAVARSTIVGGTLDGPVPTCLTGGQPPSGCPFDQVTILSQSLTTQPVSVGQGTQRRDYLTTPPVCPPSGYFKTLVTLYYADGTVETVVPTQPCVSPAYSFPRTTHRRCHRHRHADKRCKRRRHCHRRHGHCRHP